MDKICGYFLFEKIHNKKDVASSRVRGYWMMKYWPEAEVNIYGKKYEVVIYQKSYLLEHAKKFDGIKILDICDPDWVDMQPIREMVDNVDAITCPTQAWADLFSQMTDKPIIVIPDRQDLEYCKAKKIHRGRAKEVVYFGYAHNSYVLGQAMPALSRLGLNLSVISNEMVNLKTQSTAYNGEPINDRWTKWDVDTFCKELIKSDICLMPPVYKPNDRFKSNNKTTLAKALGMVVATNAEELEKFMDPVERQKESEKGLEEVRRFYDIRDSVKQMQSLIEQIKIKKGTK